MKHIVWLLCSLGFMSICVQAGELYRWTDSSGTMHYSDTPPPKSKQAEAIKFAPAAEANEALPFETRRAMKNFPVTLYVGSGCGVTCDQARSLLIKRGIPFNEKMLRSKDEIDAFKKFADSEIVPTLAVRMNFLKGYDPEQWQGELDVAGYPKIAPYRAPNTQPAVPATANPAVPEIPAAP